MAGIGRHGCVACVSGGLGLAKQDVRCHGIQFLFILSLGFRVYRNCIGFGSRVLTESFEWVSFFLCLFGFGGAGAWAWGGLGSVGLGRAGLGSGLWALGSGLGWGAGLGAGLEAGLGAGCAGAGLRWACLCWAGLGWAGLGSAVRMVPFLVSTSRRN